MITIVPADCLSPKQPQAKTAPMLHYCELDYSENIFWNRSKDNIFMQDNSD